ncbi:GNAT family N-acetyltransferase [Nocardia bhagyanarayanae]|uniref:RimJ/RimL family protein N-acetyltransferase n=1 Tax=Nocardia bhagyanarayanae TaxID=1215925 RepID=A0A543F556_9NOCA|nr:GNAT family N-acetyltransferase [Nocardia bhagyanarayanae]TQM28941.1 RimJ/RimL family protein N-acetyltransferase [Nocardia bhagyanarayanae]
MEIRTLTDGAVWLSPPTAADTDVIIARCQDPSIGEWTTIPVPYGPEDAEKFFADFVVPGWAARSPTWALRLAADGPVAGMIGLEQKDPSACEIGFWLASEHRGRGHMARAVKLVCEFGFAADGMGLARISWRAFVGNYSSVAAVRRNGFRYEGLARLGGWQRGVRRDEWLAARLHSDPPGPVADWPTEFPALGETVSHG